MPEKLIVDAMNYVRGSFDAQQSDFRYSRLPPGRYTNRAITGSGILSLALGGEHQSAIARAAGDTLLRQPLHDCTGDPCTQPSLSTASTLSALIDRQKLICRSQREYGKRSRVRAAKVIAVVVGFDVP